MTHEPRNDLRANAVYKLREELASALKECEALRAENERLQKENWEFVARGYALINMLPDETTAGAIQDARRVFGGIVDALRAENARLRKELNKANNQSERFEREWYLRGDELERLREVSRWNIERDGDDIYICDNNHDKGDKCEYERWYPRVYVEALLAENARLMAEIEGWRKVSRESDSTLDPMRSKIKRLREALKPFSRIAEFYICDADKDKDSVEIDVKVGKLRAARAAMGEGDE